MPEANEAIQWINSVGYPIVTSIALFWYMVTEQKELRNVISENTKMLSKLLEHFQSGQEVD